MMVNEKSVSGLMVNEKSVSGLMVNEKSVSGLMVNEKSVIQEGPSRAKRKSSTRGKLLLH